MNKPEKLVPFPQKQTPAISEKNGRSSLFLYAIGLLAVAAALIFLSYLSSVQHNRQEEFDAIQAKQVDFSISAMQSIENLQNENLSLRRSGDEMEAKISGLEESVKAGSDKILAHQAANKKLELENAALRNDIKELEKSVQSLKQELEALKTGNYEEDTTGSESNA